MLGENTYSAGLKFANLLDNAGLASGISLTVTGTFTSSGDSTAWATTAFTATFGETVTGTIEEIGGEKKNRTATNFYF